MPIKVSCSCGQSFTAKDELQGQTLLCPKCHQPITIGATVQQPAANSGIADLFEEAGLKEVKGKRCPKCGAALPNNAILCVQCGLNFESGERLQGAKIRKAGEQGHGEAAEDLLDRAALTIQEDQAEIKKNLSQGAPAWVYFLGLACVVAFAGAMLTLDNYLAFWYTGYGLMGLGGFVIFVYSIRILIGAFQDSLVHGFLCLFITPYMLIYIIMRWNKMGELFIMQLVGAAIIGAGVGMQALSHAIAPGEESWRAVPAPTSVVSSPPFGSSTVPTIGHGVASRGHTTYAVV